MNKDFDISIPVPCTKNWGQMAESSMGRHCDHCKTEVVDFSNWPQENIAAFLLSSRTKICGRLSTQPSIPNRLAVTASRFSLLTVLSITSVLSLAYAKNSDGKLTVVPNTIYSAEVVRDLNSIERSDSTTIKGQVIAKDEKGV